MRALCLEVHDSGLFVTVEAADSRHALVECSKFLVVVQLESQLEGLELIDFVLVGDHVDRGGIHLHPERDALTESVSMWAAEAEVQVMHAAVEGLSVCREWHSQLELVESHHAGGDRHTDGLDWEKASGFIAFSGVVVSEVALVLPGPLGAILDFDLSEEGLPGCQHKDSFSSLADEDGAFLLPFAVSSLVNLLLLEDILSSKDLGEGSHSLDHVTGSLLVNGQALCAPRLLELISILVL